MNPLLEEVYRKWLSEMTNLRRLFHYNILNPLGYLSEEDFLFVVYELMKN